MSQSRASIVNENSVPGGLLRNSVYRLRELDELASCQDTLSRDPNQGPPPLPLQAGRLLRGR
jgi:hypothetical protein